MALALSCLGLITQALKGRAGKDKKAGIFIVRLPHLLVTMI
jgi:hypothetical protein